MQPLTQLKETGIYVIEVPKESNSFEIEDGELFYKSSFYGMPDIGHFKKLPEGNWQILGTITPDNISFDPAPYLEKCEYEDSPEYGIRYNFRDYSIIDFDETESLDYTFDCDQAPESFYTLLNSCGIEIDNKLHLALIKK